MTRLSALAVDNLPLLHALAAPPEGATITSLGRDLGRDQSNLSKTLKALRDEGTVGDGLALTPAGQTIVNSIAVGGELLTPGNVVVRRHHQLRPGDNDRTDFTKGQDADGVGGALDELRISLIEHGQLQNLVITPDGQIISGERRWRAIGQIIDDGDWPAETPIACLVRDLSPLDLALARLTENLQRENLDDFDEGAAFLRLQTDHGLTDDDIADRLGKTAKHVQDRCRVAQGASEETRRRHRLPKDHDDYMTWRAVRASIQVPKEKPAVDVTPAEAVVLLELARHCRLLASHHPMFPGRDGWARLHGAPTTGGGLTLARNGLIEIADGPNPDEFYGRVARTSALLNWLHEQWGEADDYNGACHHAACEHLTPMGATLLLEGKRNATPWLNAPLPEPPPPPNEAGEVAQAPPAPVTEGALGPVNDAPKTFASELQGLIDKHQIGAEPSSPSASPPSDAPAPPPPAPAVTPPAPEADPFPKLTDRQLVMLLEVSEEIEHNPQPGPNDAYIGAKVYKYYEDPEANDLVQKGLVRFVPDARRTGFLAVLTALGEAVRRGPATQAPHPPPSPATAFWLRPPPPEAAPAAPGRTIGGPLGPMLGDAFQQQIRDAAADANEPGGEPGFVRDMASRPLALTINKGATSDIAIRAGKAVLTLDGWNFILTREDVQTLWAELGWAGAHLDGAV